MNSETLVMQCYELYEQWPATKRAAEMKMVEKEFSQSDPELVALFRLLLARGPS